jgi:hypothetical protein
MGPKADLGSVERRKNIPYLCQESNPSSIFRETIICLQYENNMYLAAIGLIVFLFLNNNISISYDNSFQSPVIHLPAIYPTFPHYTCPATESALNEPPSQKE